MNGEYAERNSSLLNQIFLSKTSQSTEKGTQIDNKNTGTIAIDIRFVVTRLKKGYRLSNDELALLKTENKPYYQKAAKIMRERAKYRSSLNSCGTKEEASNTHFVKSNAVSQEARDRGKFNADNQKETEFLQMRISAILNEYADYVKSGIYSDLPWNYKDA